MEQHDPKTLPRDLRSRHGERGAILVAVILIVVALSLTGALAIRQTSTEIQYASNAVKRDRALMAAQAALELAATRYKVISDTPNALTPHLTGYQQANPDCTDNCANCVPDPVNETRTGSRNRLLAGGASPEIDCGGRPCMRHGAVAQLPPAGGGGAVNWCNLPFNNLIMNGDPEALVSVWVRNNASDALRLPQSTDATDPTSWWTNDRDDRVVVTAQATIRNTTVAIQQEIVLSADNGAQTWLMPTPDEGYGGGHNNDNTAASVCAADAVKNVGP